MHDFTNGPAEERHRGIEVNVGRPIGGLDLLKNISFDSGVEESKIVDIDSKRARVATWKGDWVARGREA